MEYPFDELHAGIESQIMNLPAGIPDSEAVARVMDEVVGLLKDPARLSELSRNIEALAIPDSAERIVNEIERQLPQSK